MIKRLSPSSLFVLTIVILSAAVAPALSQESETEKRGFLQKLFRKSEPVELRVPSIEEATLEPVIPDLVQLRSSRQEDELDRLIADIYAAYEEKVERINPSDVTRSNIGKLPAVPGNFSSSWRLDVYRSIWDRGTAERSVGQIYSEALQHSTQVKVFADIPLIRETGIQEAEGEFDVEAFADYRFGRTNEPVGSTLTTGRPGRFLEDTEYLETGIRKKTYSGADIGLKNRWSTLSNNSDFLDPNNQGASELVLSVVQPVLRGGGYHYNTATLKIAELDARTASAEFLRQLEAHLLEVNRAYWSIYLTRASYLLKSDLVDETRGILGQLENRSDIDAIESELLRARASFAQRRATLIRSEMAVRNAEDRLRALVNNPDLEIGANNEFLPVSSPVVGQVQGSVRTVARDALYNRAEIRQGIAQLRAAGLRRDLSKNERLPEVNLVAEMVLSEIRTNKDYNRSFQDQFDDDIGYLFGVGVSHSLENNFAKARLKRSEIELRQQVNQLRTTINTVLLESVVTYRELMTAYRDMQGRYLTLTASREELSRLRERLDIDADEESRTMSYQLQLILDSMDRNQNAEEEFLRSMVNYNTAFSAVERAKGTLLYVEGVQIERTETLDATHADKPLEVLEPGIIPETEREGENDVSAHGGKAIVTERTVASPTPAAPAEKLLLRKGKSDQGARMVRYAETPVEKLPVTEAPVAEPTVRSAPLSNFNGPPIVPFEKPAGREVASTEPDSTVLATGAVE